MAVTTTRYKTPCIVRRCLPALLSAVLLLIAWHNVHAQKPPAAGYRGKTVQQWEDTLLENLNKYLETRSEEDKETCRRAVYALGQIGPQAKDAVPSLIQALQSPPIEVKEFTADALGRIGPDASQAVDAILGEMVISRELANYDLVYRLLGKFRRYAAKALGRIGPEAEVAVPVLEAALTDKDLVYRVEAAVALWKIAQHEAAIPTLEASCRQTGLEAPYAAVMALLQIGPEARSAMDTLVPTLGHEQADVRRAAAKVLSGYGAEVVEPVAQFMFDNTDIDPAPAAYVLGEALGTLRQTVFYNPQLDKTQFAAGAQPAIRLAAPVLARLLSHPREEVRQIAARSLAQMGIPATATLLAALDGEDEKASLGAGEALARLEQYLPDEAAVGEGIRLIKAALVPKLMELMQHPEGRIRAAAFRAFAELSFEDEGRVAIPLLREAYKDQNAVVRRSAARALNRYGTETSDGP
jgi:HEAT repeat protein